MSMRRILSACEVVRVESAEGVKRFTWIMSTDAPCKDELIVAQNWDLSEFKANPVIIADHERSVRTVIGRAYNVRTDEAGRLVCDIEFMSGLDEETGQPKNPLARQVEQAVEGGFIQAGSVGFHPGSIGLRKNFPEGHKYHGAGEAGYAPVVGADEPNVLHEFTICAIGADSNALRLRELAEGDSQMSALLKLHLIDLLSNDEDVRRALPLQTVEPVNVGGRTLEELFEIERSAEAESLDDFFANDK